MSCVDAETIGRDMSKKKSIVIETLFQRIKKTTLNKTTLNTKNY